MKTLNTLLTLSLLVISTASFANADDNRSEKNTNVPVAPFVSGDSMETAPEELAFIKAKSALVPVAPFIWGDPSDVPAELSIK